MNPTVTAADSRNKEPKQEPFLLERLGGQPTLIATVDIFYDRLVADEHLTKFFVGISMNRLKIHQKKFLTLVFTEFPTDIDISAYLVGKHSRLFQEHGLDGSHFDLVVGHLVTALQQLNVAADLIAEAVAILGPLRAVFADEAYRIIQNRAK